MRGMTRKIVVRLGVIAVLVAFLVVASVSFSGTLSSDDVSAWRPASDVVAGLTIFDPRAAALQRRLVGGHFVVMTDTVSEAEYVAALPLHLDNVRDVRFLDGVPFTLLVAESTQILRPVTTLYEWDVRDDTLTEIHRSDMMYVDVGDSEDFSYQVSPDGRWASLYDPMEHAVYVLDRVADTTHQRVELPEAYFVGSTFLMTYSPNSRYLAFGYDNALTVIDLPRNTLTTYSPERRTGTLKPAFSTDSRWLWLENTTPFGYALDLRTGEVSPHADVLGRVAMVVPDCAPTPDTVLLVDRATKRSLVWQDFATGDQTPLITILDNGGPVQALRWSPDCRALAIETNHPPDRRQARRWMVYDVTSGTLSPIDTEWSFDRWDADTGALWMAKRGGHFGTVYLPDGRVTTQYTIQHVGGQRHVGMIQPYDQRGQVVYIDMGGSFGGWSGGAMTLEDLTTGQIRELFSMSVTDYTIWPGE